MVERVDYGFEVQDGGDGVTSYRVKGNGIGVAGSIFAGLLVFFTAFIVAQGAPLTGLLIWIGGWGGLAVYAVRRRRWQSFAVLKDRLQLGDGKEYLWSDMGDLMLVAPHGGPAQTVQVHETVFYGGPGLGGLGTGGAGVAAAANLGQATAEMKNVLTAEIGQSIARRNWCIVFQHGRKEIPIARYLKQDVAESLFRHLTGAS